MIQFRHREDESAWQKVHPMVRWMAEDMHSFVHARGAGALLITSLVTDDPGRTTGTHAEGRAFDAITVPWMPDVVLEWAERINHVFSGYQPMKLAIFGRFDSSNRHNDHLHGQVPRGWVGEWKYGD